jgi:hypothetical protein
MLLSFMAEGHLAGLNVVGFMVEGRSADLDVVDFAAERCSVGLDVVDFAVERCSVGLDAVGFADEGCSVGLDVVGFADEGCPVGLDVVGFAVEGCSVGLDAVGFAVEGRSALLAVRVNFIVHQDGNPWRKDVQPCRAQPLAENPGTFSLVPKWNVPLNNIPTLAQQRCIGIRNLQIPVLALYHQRINLLT